MSAGGRARALFLACTEIMIQPLRDRLEGRLLSSVWAPRNPRGLQDIYRKPASLSQAADEIMVGAVSFPSMQQGDAFKGIDVLQAVSS